MDEDLRGERRTATAGARRVGVFDHELRTLEAFGVIDLGADEILVAHRVDEQHHPVFLHHRVVVALYFVESKTVLKPGAAAARDKHAQLQFGFTFDEVKRSEEHTSELQSRLHLVCRLLLEKKNKNEN